MAKIERVRLTDDLIAQYMRSGDVRTYSANTKRSKERTLRALQHIIGTKFTCQIISTDIDDTLTLLENGFGTRYNQAASRGKGRPFKGRSEQSLNVDRSNLRQFVKYLHATYRLSRAENPVELVKLADEDESEGLDKMILTPEQAKAGFAAAAKIHPRDRAIWALGLYLCMRESEILDLLWENFYLDADKPYVDFYRRKPNKFKKLYLPPAMVAEVKAWKTWVEERYGPVQGKWFVVPSRPSEGVGTRMHAEYPLSLTSQCGQLTRPVKLILEAVGMTNLDKKGIHTLRRTGAVRLYEKTQDLKLVKDWLGHVDIRTTMRYLRYSDSDKALRDAAEAYDPYGMAPEPEVTQTSEEPTSNIINLFRRRRAG